MTELELLKIYIQHAGIDELGELLKLLDRRLETLESGSDHESELPS